MCRKFHITFQRENILWKPQQFFPPMHAAGLINWKTFIASETVEIFPFPQGSWNAAHFKHNFSIILALQGKAFYAFPNRKLFVPSRVGKKEVITIRWVFMTVCLWEILL